MEKILNRIKKMLALANDAGATEGERDNAMRMAYNLMAKHNLDLADLPPDQVGESREQQTATISADKWARELGGLTAKLFFCKYYFGRTSTSGKDNHVFVGRQSNAVTALHMMEYLLKSIRREASRRYKSPTSPEGRSFCVGAVVTLRQRVRDMIATPPAELASASTALALVNLRKSEEIANLDFLNSLGMSLKEFAGRADNSLRGSAFHDGKEFGKTVSLNTQVSGSSAQYKRLH